MSVYLVKLIFFTLIAQIFSFNLSPKFHIIFNEPIKTVNSYFGYSVHLRSGVKDFSSSVVIGAPKANSSVQYLKYINEPGAVYQCDIKNDNTVCNPLALDLDGDMKGNYEGFPYIHGKSNSWLGATVDGDSTRDGKLVACAPRWINRHHIENNHPLGVGMCYFELNTHYINRTADKIIPFIDPSRDGSNYVGEAGISLHMPKADGLIFIGAVGLNYWSGGFVLYNSHNRNFIRYYEKNKFYEYLGYAVSSGRITKNGPIVYFASAPKESGQIGRVRVFHATAAEFKEINQIYFIGENLGSYFGASICVVDVNGDELDDVLIGAPRYSIDSGNIESGDEGAVYVYINKGHYKFHQPEKLKSQLNPRAEFGTSIVSLGDLDKDGYNDVVVGAPYEDDGRGAIYIYLGSAKGLNTIPSQHIRAKNINSNLFGFGISVSKGVDIDGNFYHDLAVGSYKSGHVVLFRSNPVIQLIGKIVPNENEISLDTTQFTTNICMTFSGKDVALNTKIQIIFNVDNTYKRAIIDDNRNGTMIKTISLVKDKETCIKTMVLITAKVQDFTNPIDLELTYNVHESEDQSTFCPFCPVLNPSAKTKVKVQVPYVTGCGKNSKCKPDLKLDAFVSDTIIVGSKNKVYLNINVANGGQPAFVTTLFINMTQQLGFVQLHESCMEVEEYQIKCQFNTILAKQMKNLRMELNTYKIRNNFEPYMINLTVISAGNEQNFNDNSVVVPLKLITESELRLFGNSSTELLLLDLNNKNNNYTTIQEFIVQNLGPSPINEVLFEFRIPVLYDNETVLRVFEPKDALCSVNGSSTGFYTNNTKSGDSGIEIDGPNRYRMIRDTSNLSMDKINYEEQNYTSDRKINNHFHNINRTVFFNCSDLMNDRVTCLIVTCKVPLIEDMETKATIKIIMEPQIDIIDKILGDKDILQMEFLAFTEPFDKLNKTSGSKMTMGLTIIRTLSDESYPILFIILAITLGIVILGLITWGLWKYGFFQRNTKEQLNLLQNEVNEEIENLKETNESHFKESGHLD